MITKEQYFKKMNQLSNGWRYSPDCYGKDQVKKNIELEPGKRLECVLYFSDDFDRNAWRYTGSSLIVVNVSLWFKRGDCWSSSGLGKSFVVKEKFPRKLFKYLVNESEKISDAQILAVHYEYEVDLKNPVII